MDPRQDTLADSPLLNLPVELRLSIYAFSFSPNFLSLHHSDYFGLFLSCKRVYQEMKSEAVRSIEAYLTALNTGTTAIIRVSSSNAPPSLNTMKDLVVSLPTSLVQGFTGRSTTTANHPVQQSLDFSRLSQPQWILSAGRGEKYVGYPLPDILRVLLRLRLQTLTINIHVADDPNDSTTNMSCPCSKLMLGLCRPLSFLFKEERAMALPDEVPRCAKIVLEHEKIWHMIDRHGLTNTLRDTDNDFWSFEVGMNENKVPVRVAWEKKRGNGKRKGRRSAYLAISFRD